MKRPIAAIYDMTPEEFDRHLRRNARLSAKQRRGSWPGSRPRKGWRT